MREFYTTSEATQDQFLFISYSHDDQETVKAWADYLIDQGVRVWWDKAFMGGDDWETIAKELLSHENCCGLLFFCSKSAIASPNVAKEWRTAAKTKEARPEGSFYPQIIMATDDPDLDYKYLTNFVKKTEELFSDDDYDDFRSLFGKKDHLYYSAANQTDREALLQTIKQRVPETVDAHAIALDKLADISNSGKKDMILKLGTYGPGQKPLLWRHLHSDDKEAVLLCQEVLTEELGGQQAEAWLRDFAREAFSEDQTPLRKSIHIMTPEEAAASHQILSAARYDLVACRV